MIVSDRQPRLPKNHKLVYDVIRCQEPGSHAAACDVYAAAKLRQPEIGYSTVYRALHRLRDLGLVLEVRVPGASSALYECSKPFHAHFLCDGCGSLEDMDCAFPLDAIQDLSTSREIEVASVFLTIHGRCRGCRRVDAHAIR